MNTSGQQPRVLIIEDEPDIAYFIAQGLTHLGLAVAIAGTGQSGWAAYRQEPPDLILLDRCLPDVDGLDLCRRIRQVSPVPIIMLSAKVDVADRVSGLNAGANDYLIKPFHFDELVARVNVQLRPLPTTDPEEFRLGDLRLSTRTHLVLRGPRAVPLSPREFDLLVLLISQADSVVKRQQILMALWGNLFDGSVLDVCVSQLRQKLEAGGEPRLLHTVRGVGYVLRIAP